MTYFANGTIHRILTFHQINSMPQGCTISHVLIQAINRELEPKKRSRNGWEVHLESKDQIFFRQDYASRIYLRQTYSPIPSSIHKFSRLVTGKQRQTYASRRGKLMGKVTFSDKQRKVVLAIILLFLANST
jgi:hypothetical protein